MYVGRIERLLAYYSPLPMCIVNAQGKVTRASRKIAEVFKYDGIVDYDVFALTGIKMPELVEAAEEGTPLFIQRNDKTFRIGCDFLGGNDGEEEGASADASIILHFTDITDYEDLKERYKDDRVYMMLVNVDNFDEIISGSSDDSDSNVRVNIDKLIRSWAAGMEAMVVRYRENMYELAITHSHQVRDDPVEGRPDPQFAGIDFHTVKVHQDRLDAVSTGLVQPAATRRRALLSAEGSLHLALDIHFQSVQLVKSPGYQNTDGCGR